MLSHSTFLVLLLASFIGRGLGHGCMNFPNQRGALTTRKPQITNEVDADAPIDWFMQFPAGDKTASPGSALRSQIRAAGPNGWTPFEPLRRNFHWRAGVCGDLKNGPQNHRKGGIYYYGGKIVKQYEQGDVMDVSITITAHHNGFMELHICDVAKCPGGEISEQCFRMGHCKQLQRAYDSECESGNSRWCGPIDRNFPGRWYLPCSRYPGNDERSEFFTHIKYKLPDNLHCKHCVVQWFWTAAATCNPPGVREYFTSRRAPKWGNCKGQGAATGGFAAGQRTCGGKDRFPEEYLQCADIAIDRKGGTSSPRVSATPRPRRANSPDRLPANWPWEQYKPRTGNGIRDLILIVRGHRAISLLNRRSVNIRSYYDISIEAVTSNDVPWVRFEINGRTAFTDRKAPFYLNGNDLEGRARAWRPLIIGRQFKLKAIIPGDTDEITVRLTRS